MSNRQSTSSALSIDRLSNEELLRRGIAVYEPSKIEPPTPAMQAEDRVSWAPMYAEVPGIIYVLQAPPLMPVKIGFTRATELAHRLKGLQTGCPYSLKVIAQITGLPAREREIHALLATDRLTGEWFDWTPRVRAFVDSLTE